MADWQTKVAQLFALAGSTDSDGEKRNAMMSGIEILLKNQVDIGSMLMKRAPDAPVKAEPSCARCSKAEKRAAEEIERHRLRADVRVSDLLIQIQELQRQLEAEKAIRRALEKAGAKMAPPSAKASPMEKRIRLRTSYGNTACKACAQPVKLDDFIFWRRGDGVICAPCFKKGED